MCLQETHFCRPQLSLNVLGSDGSIDQRNLLVESSATAVAQQDHAVYQMNQMYEEVESFKAANELLHKAAKTSNVKIKITAKDEEKRVDRRSQVKHNLRNASADCCSWW